MTDNKKHTVIASIISYILIAVIPHSHCQNQNEVDSISAILKTKKLDDSTRIFLTDKIMGFSSKPEDIFYYASELINLVKENGPILYEIRAYQMIGVSHRLEGQLEKSLENLLLSAEIAIDNQLAGQAAESYLEIGTTYTSNNDNRNALIYNRKAIDIFRDLSKQQELAINLLNTGYIYYEITQYDSALLYYNEAAPIFDSLNFTIGRAYAIGNRALVYWKMGQNEIAKRDLLQTIALLIPLGDQYGIADYQNNLGNIYLEEGNNSLAIIHLEKGLEIAQDLDLKQQISDANQKLSELYETKGDFEKSLSHFKSFMTYRDSVVNLETVRGMADQRTDFEVSLRESEISILEKEKKLQQTYIIIAIIIVLLSLVVILYFRQRFRNTRLLAEVQQKENKIKVNNLLKDQETKALQAMLQGKEEERRHLAKELHNHLGSLLATVKMNLNGLESPDKSKYQTIIHLVDHATQDVRNISHQLNMGVSEDFGLLPALKELVKHLQKVNKLKVVLSASLEAVTMDSKSEILAYRIVQELISNVLKHADATALSISLTGFEEGNLLNILVEDNGKGFKAESLDHDSKGIGLDSLNEMINKMDGKMSIDSGPKTGTTISIDLPIIAPEITLES